MAARSPPSNSVTPNAARLGLRTPRVVPASVPGMRMPSPQVTILTVPPDMTPLQLPTVGPSMNLSFHEMAKLPTPMVPPQHTNTTGGSIHNLSASAFPSAPIAAPSVVQDEHDFVRDHPREYFTPMILPYMLELARLGWPQSIATLVTTFQTTALFVILGMFGGDGAINAIGLGISILYAFSHSFNFGFVATLDTLTSQEYGRKPASPLIGRQLKAVLLCITITTMVTASVHAFITPIVLGQMWEARLASDVGRFVTASPFYPLSFGYVYAIGKFAMNQQQPSIPSTAAIITAVASIPIFYVTLSNAPKEYFIEAAGLAFSFVYFMQVCLLLFMVQRNKQTSTTLGGATINFTLDGDLVSVVRIGIPSIPLVGGEMAVFNVIAIMAGLLTNAETEAYLIRGNIGDLGFALVYGVTAGATARIGEATGANQPRKARRYIAAAIVLTTMVATFDMVVYFFTYPQLYRFYTDDPATLEAAKSLTYPFIVYHYGDMWQYMMMLIYCALGLNHRGAYMSAGVLWGIGVPTVYIAVTVFHVHVFGFTLTWSLSLVTLAFVYLGALRRYTDINQLAAKAAADHAGSFVAPPPEYHD